MLHSPARGFTLTSLTADVPPPAGAPPPTTAATLPQPKTARVMALDAPLPPLRPLDPNRPGAKMGATLLPPSQTGKGRKQAGYWKLTYCNYLTLLRRTSHQSHFTLPHRRQLGANGPNWKLAHTADIPQSPTKPEDVDMGEQE